MVQPILNLREILVFKRTYAVIVLCFAPLIDCIRPIEGRKAVAMRPVVVWNAVLHEFAQAQKVGIQIDETVLPIRQEVRGICELLGLDALNFA